MGLAGPELRVIIAGGSVTGLSLALMLDQAGVDFTLLEARDTITPQVGAGVALNANGFRIVDQLGLYDELVAAGRTPLDYACNWWPDGSLHSRDDGVSELFFQTMGYPMLVLDRQQLLKILFGKNRRQDKIVTGARIESVSEDDDGVSVVTTDGRIFEGDVLVGADGVHSTIRREMWRIGREKAPGYFTGNEINDIKCNWMTMFGIAAMPEGLIEEGGVNTTFHHGASLGVMAGGNHRCYFFMNQALPKELTGKEIPRFTEADCEQMARSRWEEKIQGDVKFKDLYQARVRAVLVPLQEYVMKKWHFGRIITIGDSAHKLHPVTGQGAMLALEDAATLVNLLCANLNQTSPRRLDAGQIRSILAQTQDLQKSRSEKLVAESFMAQKMHAWHTPLLKFVATQVMPRLGFDVVLNLFLEGARSATCLRGPNFREVPRRGPALVGFDDQHPEPRSMRRSTIRAFVLTALCLLSLCVALRPSWSPSWFPVLSDGFGNGAEEQAGLASSLFRLNATGILALLLTEGYRRSNKLLPIHWPIIWSLLGDSLGFERVVPFACLLNALHYSSRGRMQYAVTHRAMASPSVHKYALPIAVLMHALPAALALRHDGLSRDLLGLVAAQMLDLPLATMVTMATLAASYLSSQQGPFFGTRYVAHLQRGYGGLLVVLTLCHARFAGVWNPAALIAGHPEAALAYTALLSWLVFVVSEVCHYRGLPKSRGALFMLSVPALFVLVGPGAAAVSVWWWRERTISRDPGMESPHAGLVENTAKS